MGKVKEKLMSSATPHAVSWPGKSAPVSVPASGPSAEESSYLFDVEDVPQEVRAAAQHRFGAGLRMSAPRLNGPGYRCGGTYKGEIFSAGDYLVQEVAPRSVVFHRKDKLMFFSLRLRAANGDEQLDGIDVQIGYDGDRPGVYAWDRAHEQLTGVVASLKKSAKELGMPELAAHDGVLEKLAEHTWERIRQMRRAAGTSRQPISDQADGDVIR